jgi:hypothetical protein
LCTTVVNEGLNLVTKVVTESIVHNNDHTHYAAFFWTKVRALYPGLFYVATYMTLKEALTKLEARMAEAQSKGWEQVQALKNKNVFVCAEILEPDGAYTLDAAISNGTVKEDDVEYLAGILKWEGDMQHLKDVLLDTDEGFSKEDEFQLFLTTINERCRHYLAHRVNTCLHKQ